MAVTIRGTRISFNDSNDTLVLNCPIKQIQYAASTAGNLNIDGVNFYVGGANEGIKFHSLHGYPGAVLSVGTISAPIVLNITEIGDVLNPNYFEEDIRNWNGQGATAVSEASEAPKKTAKSKKAEVSE